MPKYTLDEAAAELNVDRTEIGQETRFRAAIRECAPGFDNRAPPPRVTGAEITCIRLKMAKP